MMTNFEVVNRAALSADLDTERRRSAFTTAVLPLGLIPARTLLAHTMVKVSQNDVGCGCGVTCNRGRRACPGLDPLPPTVKPFNR